MTIDPPGPGRLDRRNRIRPRGRPDLHASGPDPATNPDGDDTDTAARTDAALQRLRTVLEETDRRLGAYLDAARAAQGGDTRASPSVESLAARGTRASSSDDRPPVEGVHGGRLLEPPRAGTPLESGAPLRSGDPTPIPTRVTSVVVADDSERFRRGLVQALDDRPGIRVVGEAATGRATRELVSALRPQVVLCDLRMPDVDGVELIRELATAPGLLGVRIAVLSSYGDEMLTLEARAAGANTSVDKAMSRNEIADVVEALANG